MNTIIMTKEGTYQLTNESGHQFDCKVWFEKKSGKNHVKLPDNNGTGRTYIRQEIVDLGIKSNEKYEFETKTTGPRVLGSSTQNWKSQMTKEEKELFEKAEKVITEIKEKCSKRVPSESDLLNAQILKLQEKLKLLKK